MSFPTDFPSANRLLASGIRRALVIQQASGAVEPDLADTLRRWQEAGRRAVVTPQEFIEPALDRDAVGSTKGGAAPLTPLS